MEELEEKLKAKDAELAELKKQTDERLGEVYEEKYKLEEELERLKYELERSHLEKEAMQQRYERDISNLHDELEYRRSSREESKARLQEASPFVFEDVKKYKEEIEQLQHALGEECEKTDKIRHNMTCKLEDAQNEIQKLRLEMEELKQEPVEVIGSGQIFEYISDDSKGKDEEIELSELNDDSEKKLDNGWTTTTNNILLTWKLNISKVLFIYGFILEKYKGRLENFLIYALISNTIGTALSAISAIILGLYQDDSVWGWLVFGISIVMVLTDGLASILNGIMTIKKYPEFTTNLSGYNQKLNNFYAIVSSQYMLPLRLRDDGDEFIKKENEIRIELLQEAPSVNIDDYNAGNEKFEQFAGNYV